MIPDNCSLCKGKLKMGTTEFIARASGEVVVIKDVPAFCLANNAVKHTIPWKFPEKSMALCGMCTGKNSVSGRSRLVKYR